MSAGGTIDADEIERICIKLTRLADSVRKTQPTFDRRSALGLPSPDRTTLAGAIARRYLKRRRARDAVLPRELLGDPDWEMLLDLFAAECEGRAVSVSSLCLAAGGCGTPPTTALRHVSRLEKLGIVIRVPDPDDRRRCFMRLAPEIGPKLERWLLDTWPE